MSKKNKTSNNFDAKKNNEISCDCHKDECTCTKKNNNNKSDSNNDIDAEEKGE